MKQKSLGSAVMVSGWISPAGGLEFYEKHEHATQGYWTSDHMLAHTDKLIGTVVAAKYRCTGTGNLR